MSDINAARDTSEGKKRVEIEKMPDYLRISKPANLLISMLFVLIAFVCVLPAVFCLIISLSAERESIEKIGYSFFPLEWSLDAYKILWRDRQMIGQATLVSIFITVSGVALGLFLNATMAYVLSRPTYKFRKFFSVFVMIPMLFSGGMVASYMINARVFRMENSFVPLIVLGSVGTWYVMILSTFFRTTVPESLIESAKIDGAAQIRIFLQIVLPISLPALATVGLYLTFGYWNAWFEALMYLDSNHTALYPLQYVLIKIQHNIEFIAQNPQLTNVAPGLAENIPRETTRMAIVMFIVIPIVFAYPFFQRYFITGLTVGAVKG